jgi:hypothetical protein
MRETYIKVNKLTKPVHQTDYLQMLGQAVLVIEEYNGKTTPNPAPVLAELPIHTNAQPIKED